MKRFYGLYMAFVAVILLNSSCVGQTLSKKEWLEDLSYLQKGIYGSHINPFWKHSQATFDSAFNAARQYINQSTPIDGSKVVTEFAKLLALTGDGHSGVSAKSRGELFGLYPYNVAWFPEGLFLTRTIEPNRDILGTEVIEIDGMPINRVKELVKTVSTSFHEQGFRRFSTRYIESPVILNGLGISKSPEKVTLTLKDQNGVRSEVSFSRISLKEFEKTKFISMSDLALSFPLYRQNLRKNYWFTYLKDQKILYINYINSANSKDESMEAFVKRMTDTLKGNEIEKTVVDVRLNPGGDQFTAWPLLSFLVSNKQINQPGKLFAITGQNTFSAATAFLEALETKTNCIIVGTPPADSPSYPAEDNTIVLPNSKMEARLSTEMWNYSFDGDDRNIIAPDLEVQTYFKDFTAGHDPIFEAIRNYKHAVQTSTIKNPEKYKGRYAFGLDKTLEINFIDNELRADVKGRLHTALTPLSEDKFATGIKGVILEIKENEVIYHSPTGSKQSFRKLQPNEFTALDHLIAGQYDLAKEKYELLKKNNPSNINLNGTTLAGLAFYLVVETMNFEMCKALLDIAVKLDPKSEVAKNLAITIEKFTKK